MEPCPHLKYFNSTYKNQLISAAETVNTHYRGKKVCDVPFDEIHRFCSEVSDTIAITYPEELNHSCENYQFHMQCTTPSYWAYTPYAIAKCTEVEFLSHDHLRSFLELVATYTIVLNATVSHVGTEVKYKWYSGSSIEDCWSHDDYLDTLYWYLGGPKPKRKPEVLRFSDDYQPPEGIVERLPKEYEEVMIRPIPSTYKVPNVGIWLNDPYPVGVEDSDCWPSGGYMYPFYAVYCVNFNYSTPSPVPNLWREKLTLVSNLKWQ